MPDAFESRLRRLEVKCGQTSRKFVVVANEAERDTLARAEAIPASAVVIITGVPRPYPSEAPLTLVCGYSD